MKSTVAVQIHDGLYDALRAVETRDLRGAEPTMLKGIAGVVSGLCELLDAIPDQGDATSQTDRSEGPSQSG